MTASDIELFRTNLSMWQECEKKYLWRAKKNNDTLSRSDSWRLEYFKTPYLTLASDEYVERRFIDHFHNNIRLTAEGKIAPHYEFTKDDGLLGPLFAHLWLEIGTRDGLLARATQGSKAGLHKYFENGTPKGVSLFKGLPDRLENIIVKFGRKEHLLPMLNHGHLRLTPANFYQRGSLLKAMRDLEIEREFHDPQFAAMLRGETTARIGGLDAKLEDGFAKIVVTCPEYVLWSACVNIDRRLPEDFGADAALIINDPKTFVHKLNQKVRSMWPKASIWSGNIKYYDPCSFIGLNKRPEIIKHFSFYYQQEWRFCAFPDEDVMPTEPVQISLGPLNSVASLVALT